MGLHKRPCPCTHTHTYPHVHTFTRALTCLCIRSPACTRTLVHAFTCAHHTRVDTFTRAVTHHWCLCSPAWVCAPSCAHVLTHMGCSYLCVHVCSRVCMHALPCVRVQLCVLICACMHSPACAHVHLCAHVFSCVHQHACTCIPPRSCVLSQRACSCAPTFSHMHTCIYPGVCSHAFTYTHLVHMLTCMHPSMFPCFHANVYVHTHVHAPTTACPCAPTPACAHTPALTPPRVPVHMPTPTHTCSHASAGAVQLPALPLHAALAWGERARACPVVPSWLAEAMGSIWLARGQWLCPPTPPCSAGLNQGIPEPAQHQQHCTTPGIANPAVSASPWCHP